MSQVIAGKVTTVVPEVGKIYEVRHSRKGTFVLKVTSLSDEWITGVIVGGVAKAMMADNVRFEGEEITIRDSMSQLVEVDQG